ncbi:cytochrome d ubiquinol oxidase subunit II [Hamadaea tsunoensis]|uniref:cytochrome d ubiquinol oxidase subunit II n=1 Tax=Hamadaea tsunoensis TaxID=53368 RepID=UPI0003F6976B|nr:cytochrome d ubiquinol oxidase subunit II [Hamadaea tsunoensis]
MLIVLAVMFTGYFLLGGLDYGVGIMARDRAEMNRVAPFFLGNEVWLVAAAGLLFGAYPWNEGELLGAYRVPVWFALGGAVLVVAAYGLRIFKPGGALDGVARVGAVVAALGWGAFLGAVWQGGEFRLTPLVMASSVGLLALLCAHGWAFLRRRWLLLAATSMTVVAAVLLAGSAVTWHAADRESVAVIAPVVMVALPVLIAVQAVTWWLFRTRHPSEAKQPV